MLFFVLLVLPLATVANSQPYHDRLTNDSIDSTGDSALCLFQASVMSIPKTGERRHKNLKRLLNDTDRMEADIESLEADHSLSYKLGDLAESSWATAASDDYNAGVCGTRPMMPILQLELEAFHQFGVLTSSYTRCRVPSRDLHELDQQGLEEHPNHHQAVKTARTQTFRSRLARVITTLWAMGAVYVLMRFTVGTYRNTKLSGKATADQLAHELQKKIDQGGFFGSLAQTWLDPVIGLYSRAESAGMTPKDVNSLEPDFQYEPYANFRKIWQDELSLRGLSNANLFSTVARFLGPKLATKMVVGVGCTLMLDLAGLTLGLDLFLNYLRWASDTHTRLPFASLDTLGPTVMILVLAMGMPVAARVFTGMVNLCDAFHCNRIVAGLMCAIYEKSHRLPVVIDEEEDSVDVNQLVTNDAVKVWSGTLKCFAQLLMAPLCSVAFFGLLVHKLAWSAVFGAGTVACFFVIYIPLISMVRRGNMRWLTAADRRVHFMKDMLFNIRSVRGLDSEETIAQRIHDAREEELSAKLRWCMTLSFMGVPTLLMPLAVIGASLMFRATLHGPIEAAELFVCMQVLSAWTVCSTIFNVAFQKTVNLPNSIKRIETFLRQSEKPKKAKQESTRHPNAPVVQLRGSFAYGPGQEAVLRDVDLAIKKGELVALVGEAGCGKSTLLNAMLGELCGVDQTSTVDAPEHIAYCAQTPWLINGLLHENVTLNEHIDPIRYEQALEAASFKPKLETLIEPQAATVSAGAQDATERKKRLEEQPEQAQAAPLVYFYTWNVMVIIALVLGVVNVDWKETPLVLGVVIVFIQGLLHWSVMEIPLQTIATFFFSREPPKPQRADGSHLSVCLNYNLLAVGLVDVDECMANMYRAYMGSIADNVSAVLVSATNSPELKEYELKVRDECRERIYKELAHEGLVWAGFEHGTVDVGRRARVWSRFAHMDAKEFAQVHLNPLCKRFAQEFMVVHRVSRVLRKCGQYQDLMLLSEGYDTAFTYTDKDLYGDAARPLGQPLFYDSDDTKNCVGRRFDYTLVLDADTCVKPNSVFDMLEIGAGNPERAIIQPSIQMDCSPGDSIFIHIEAMRQTINAPLTNTLTALLGESGFYGKGLIKNARYIEQCLGTPEALIEVVPIDVLSHDTFEAAVVGPLYAGDVQLLEAPCGNYVTWDIRERRWNRGEILLAMYFFPKWFGTPTRWLQNKLQGKQYNPTEVRTKANLSRVSEYMAHSALRQIMMKPLLVMYICLMDFVQMHYEWTPLLAIMFLIIVFPKFATCNRDNCRGVLLETIASVLQFTPECMVGTIRILRALKAHFTGNAQWVPQRAVEEEFEKSNPFVFSFNYLWYYPCFAFISGIVVVGLVPNACFIMWMLGTLFCLPLYAGVTALKTRGENDVNPFPYFGFWNVFTFFSVMAGFCNIHWENTNATLGVFVVGIQALLHWSVMEIPLQTIATFFAKTPPKPNRGDATNLTVCLNYNLLSVNKADVDECMENMYDAYMGSISEKVSAVLISATNDPDLKDYELSVRDECRHRIFNELIREGLVWAGFEQGKVDPGRSKRVWSKFKQVDRDEFKTTILPDLCQNFAKEFMVLHRVSRVLRKCGQYQDLMLLSAGEPRAFTYTDFGLYGDAARLHGEFLFEEGDDTDNVVGRGYDYTLVLDADTCVVRDSVFEMLEIGAGNPERAIIQPAIQMDCKPGDSIFIHIEAMRQTINAPLTNTLTALLGESGFYGKGLIKNSVYINKCLGTPENPIEVVPIDVLSHDTFEAAVVSPLYAGDVKLLEAPCGNYVTWDIRERRWNRGEVLLAMYFFPDWVGKPMRWMQYMMQGKQFRETKVRTKASLSPISEYMAHSALRQILLKPILVTYIIFMDFVEMHYEWTPFLLAMFLIIVFPKFATCNSSNFKAVILETTASILQFTPECLVGTIRILRALKAHLTGNAKWIPQRAVEEEFEKTNPFIFSFSYLWYYPFFGGISAVLVSRLVPNGRFIMWMFGTLFALPLYAGVTALRTPKKPEGEEEEYQIDASANSGETLFTVPKLPIGPRGALLSAGERAQVALARAAYSSRAELVLVDDPFAAMDSTTGESVMDNLASSSLFEGRTRVVAMQPRGDYLHRFDRVVVMEGGRIVAQGPPDQVVSVAAVQRIIGEESQLANTSHAGDDRLRQAGPPRTEALEAWGASRWSTVGEVGLSSGPWRLVAATICVLLLRIVVIGQILLLGMWADRTDIMHPSDGGLFDHPGVDTTDGHYLYAILFLLATAAILQGIQNYLILTFNNNASRSLFEQAFSSLLRAPIDSFWSRQPIGRVINRLLADMLTIDVNFSVGFFALLGYIFNFFIQQMCCLAVLPKYVAFPMYMVMGTITIACCSATTPLQYCSLMALSTCQDEQASALASAPSARAYRQQGKQIANYCENASAFLKPNYLGVACAKQWLAFRITFCLCFQCTVCMLYGVVRSGDINITALALVALSTFNLLQDLDNFIDSIINSIGVSLALQRIAEYFRKSKLQSPHHEAETLLLTRQLIDQGSHLQLDCLRVSYSGSVTDAVGPVSAKLAAGGWMGVVGPAGSGKSSMLMGIAQLVGSSEGSVTLGGVDLRACSAQRSEFLRATVRYVPQEPSVFRGSIRFNVDPCGQYTDERVWKVLQCTQLQGVVANMPFGLDSMISRENCCLSFGQRQLLSLARAICQQPALLLLDGSLSTVDLTTVQAIRRELAISMPTTTVVLATQRVATVASLDYVIVLQHGVVLEQGPPDQLNFNAADETVKTFRPTPFAAAAVETTKLNGD